MQHPPDDATRVSTLRRRCIDRKEAAWRNVSVATARSLRASEDVASWQVRKGLCTRDRLRAVRFALDDQELLAGRLAPRPGDIADAEIDDAAEYLRTYPRPGGQVGHCQLDCSRPFGVGLDGMRRDLRARMETAAGRAVDVYGSMVDALDGLTDMADAAARAADRAATDAPEWRRAELTEIAESCRRVAHLPPATFRDAIQLVWFMTFGVMHGDGAALAGPGRIDRVLGSFYEADVAAGRLTREGALLLIEGLYLLINEYVPDGLAMPVMVGGRDAGGRDLTNELSYLCLEALRRTRLIYPTVGVCWHEGTPADLVDLAIDLIGGGCSTPAFFGDETIRRGLEGLGAPAEQACNYINSTCVEITPCGASNVWVASPYFSMCGMLLDEIDRQVTSGRVAADFASFRDRYHERLGRRVAQAVRHQNELRRERRRHGGKPLQSAFTRDCIERGRDLDDGGAVYNWVECSFVGLANLVDSLHVIREEVYRQGTLTLGELKAIMDADFEGNEPARRRFLEGHAKYGQDVAEVDALFGETVEILKAECEKHKMEPDGSPFVPGAFCWIMHERLGRECGATPDGRRRGTPFADGCGPAQGREARGPTAAILSTTSWDHSPMIGGLAYNMKFSRSVFRPPASLDSLRDLVLTFLRLGGFETQINLVDAETLEAARADPEEYRDLVVRIGGYADYFTRLSPGMQDEIIMRTEFGRA